MVVLEQLRLALRNDESTLRPHERESMLTRDNASEIRFLAMSGFPVVAALAWTEVADGLHVAFAVAVAAIIATNIIGWVVPWLRYPRWVESIPPHTAVIWIWLMAATTGGMSSGFGMLLLVPLIWIALYADPADIAIGLLICTLLVIAPMHDWLPGLPDQGTLAQRVALIVVLATVVISTRPIVIALREQVRSSRRAMHSLRASQAALAHDLRTPLTSICALAELADQRLSEGTVDIDAVREYMRRISALGWRAESTIRGVLDLSEAAELLPATEQIDVRRALEDVARTIDGVSVHIADVPATIIGHEPSLRRLFANLFENAAVHGVGPTPDDIAHVHVEGTDQVGGWRFTVRDQGPGIPSEEANVVFQPWRRGAGARDGGHGLGLAIVAAIVEQHGGTIAVEDAPDSGAAFTFTLSRTPRRAHDQHEVVARAATGVPLA